MEEECRKVLDNIYNPYNEHSNELIKFMVGGAYKHDRYNVKVNAQSPPDVSFSL